MREREPYLTESALADYLALLFPEARFVFNRAVPGARMRGRPDYRCESLKLIVEFDGYSHYARSAVILKDREKDSAFEAMGYRVVRIPYFVQMSEEIANHLFAKQSSAIEQTCAHGFIADDALLPADFCGLGIERFLNDLKRFHFIAPEIVASLRAKVREYDNPRLVVPPPQLEMIAGCFENPEGVTKFQLDFREAPPPEPDRIAPLNAWRTVLHRLGLTSQDPRRYGGVGFGNVSLRASGSSHRGSAPLFVISGTQTGGLARLTERHYCRVIAFDLLANSVRAEGPIPPSSESLTHAAIYQAAPAANCVLHVHSPEIWRHAEVLGIAVVDERIAYGTPEMADAVGALVGQRTDAILAMGGHEDGIVAYGTSVDETAANLIQWFVRALQLAASRETA